MDFDYEGPRTSDLVHVYIERVKTWLSMAEAKHGAVGDRFECVIERQIGYVWYSRTQPRQ